MYNQWYTSNKLNKYALKSLKLNISTIAKVDMHGSERPLLSGRL